MKYKIVELEEILKCEIKKNFKCLGVDTATRTGICLIETKEKIAEFKWAFIQFEKKQADKYAHMIKYFESIIKGDEDIIVIEDTHLKFHGRFPQVQTLKQLTRYGAFGISESVRKNIPYQIIGASSARSKLGINTRGCGRNKSKLAVANWLKENLNLELNDEDISDAIVLALLGIIEDMDFAPKTVKKKRRVRKTKKIRRRKRK